MFTLHFTLLRLRFKVCFIQTHRATGPQGLSPTILSYERDYAINPKVDVHWTVKVEKRDVGSRSTPHLGTRHVSHALLVRVLGMRTMCTRESMKTERTTQAQYFICCLYSQFYLAQNQTMPTFITRNGNSPIVILMATQTIVNSGSPKHKHSPLDNDWHA